jgi:hypothetical protein
MRLTHIFWSLVVLAIMIILPTLLFLNHGKLQGGPEIFGAFLIFWWAIDALTPIMLIAAWLRKSSLQKKFFYTFLAVLNLYFGLMGIYHLLQGGSVHLYPISFILFLFNFVCTGIIAYYQVRPRQPVSRNA